MHDISTATADIDFLSDGGEMGALMRSLDWDTSPLGAPAKWPQSLRSVVGLMLGSKFPMFAAWGDSLGFLYNDSYAPILGEKHPTALGRSFHDVWTEIWPDISPLIDSALRGEATYFADLPLTMQRKGFDEDTWFTFSYSPLRDETGKVVGMFCACTETTAQKLALATLEASERRLKFLNRLAEQTAPLADADEVLATTTRLLGEHLGLSVCAYADMDEDQDGFTIRGDWAAPGATSIVGHYSLADFGRLAVRNLVAGEPLVVNDNLRELAPEEAATFQNIGIAATICMPLVKEGRLTALMAIHDRVPRDWTDEELDLLKEVTSRSWAHIERVGAVADLRSSETALRTLNADLERQVVQRTQARGRTWQVSPDLMGALNAQGYFETSNPAWQVVLGWSEAEVARKPIRELLHPDDLEAAREGFGLARSGQSAIRFHNRCRTKVGAYRWISWVGVAEDGLVYCTGRDITEEVAREAELAARTAERDRLWTLSQDMFARANLEGMMSAVSPAWTQVLGWSEVELLTRPYATFMHEEDMGPTLAALARMGETGQPTRFENRIATKEGGWKPIEWTVAPELEGQNFIAVGRDLSEMKARNAELAAAQDALRQSQKMEAVGQLTGGLAHDFNNIIAGIGGSLDMMATRLAQGRIGDLDRYITGASGAAKRAAGLTQRLLAFSRRQTLDPKPTDLNTLVNGMLDLVNRSMGPEVQVETVGAAGLWITMVDAGQLENALLNLCINARDAMPGGGTLTIETSNRLIDERGARHHALQPGQYVCLCVSDTGTGMSEEVIERAFDPFYTTKPTGQGTGLGLSMVYGFAAQSGGAARIYSEVGNGTRVCIYLPRHDGYAPQEPGPETEKEAPRAAGGETVLLVDDEPLVRMIAAEALEELGYNVIEAGDGAMALKILDSKVSIDLLITDVGLPGGTNGRQVADAARVSKPELKVLFITGYAENAVLNHGHLDHGMHIMTKPFELDVFARKVKDLISDAR